MLQVEGENKLKIEINEPFNVPENLRYIIPEAIQHNEVTGELEKIDQLDQEDLIAQHYDVKNLY